MLKFSDGGYIKGNFDHDEIVGQGERKWANGSMYVGNFFKGEMDG